MKKHSRRTELVYEVVSLEPGELPPLDQNAELVLRALREAPHPLSHRNLEKETNLSCALVSNSLALLMMHQLVERDHCRKKGQFWRLVGHAYPAPRPGPPNPSEPRKPKLLQGQDELF